MVDETIDGFETGNTVASNYAEPAAYLYDHRNADEQFIQPNKANMDPRYWTETPPYAHPPADEITRLQAELREARHERDGETRRADVAQEEVLEQARLLGMSSERELALRADLERTTRNRDMWKGQCERQAEELARVRKLGEGLAEAHRQIMELPGEINPSNYSHDDVCALNAAHIEAYEIARAALAAWHQTVVGEADEITRLQAELREARHERDGYMAERDMARERLEWSANHPDGIAARDETIARTERNRDMWRGQCERQAEELARLRKLGQWVAVAYTLGCIANEDWRAMTADDARREASDALAAWEAGR